MPCPGYYNNNVVYIIKHKNILSIMWTTSLCIHNIYVFICFVLNYYIKTS